MKKVIIFFILLMCFTALLVLMGRASCIEEIGNNYYLYKCDFESIKHKKNKSFYLSEVLYIKQTKNIAVGIVYPILKEYKSINCKKFTFFIYLKTVDEWFFFCSLKELNQKLRKLKYEKFYISKSELNKANSRFIRRKKLYSND